MGNYRKLTTWLNGYYNYTVILTYIGMLIGFFGVLNAFNEHYDAALIWMSNGKDEDYTFGYTEEELEDALR